MSGYDLKRHPSRLTGAALDVLAEAYKECNGGVVHIPIGDRYLISSGSVTRTGRILAAAGFLRPVAGSQVWLPGVPGAGKHRTDPPAVAMEITPEGVAALRRRMGPDAMAQLDRLRQREVAR